MKVYEGIIGAMKLTFALSEKEKQILEDLLTRLATDPYEDDAEYYCPVCGGPWYSTPASPASGDPRYLDTNFFVEEWTKWAKENPDEAYMKLPRTPGFVSGFRSHFALPFGARIPEHMIYREAVEGEEGHEDWCPLGKLLEEIT